MKFKSALKKLNNKAFSLIELVVVVAILGIMGTGLVAFMAVSMKSYRSDSADINIQTQAQMAANQLENLILDASNGVCYGLSTDAGTGVSTKSLQLFSFDFDRKAKVRELVYKDSTDSFLYYVRDEKLADTWNRVDTSQLFATYIDSFDVTIYDDKGNDITGSTDSAKAVQVEIRFKYSHGGREYEETRLVTLRNKVILNSDEDRIFDNISDQTIPAIRQVFLNLLQDGRLWVGDSYENLFDASLIGTNTAALKDLDKYEFAIGNPGPSDGATTLTSDGKTLNLAAKEKYDLQIIATSKANSEDPENPVESKSATVKIYPKYISGGKITDIKMDSKAKTATITFSVVVHNGVGDDAEKTEVTDTLTENLRFDNGADKTNKIEITQLTKTIIRGNTVTYLYETKTDKLNANKDHIYTISGYYSKNHVTGDPMWSDSLVFNIKDEESMEGTFELRSNTVGASGSTVYPGETFDIFGGYILVVNKYIDKVYPINPSDMNLTITKGLEYFNSDGIEADGRITSADGSITLKKQNEMGLSDLEPKEIVFKGEYHRGVHDYSQTFTVKLKPLKVTVKQFDKTKNKAIALNVDDGRQSRELLPYDATASFTYDMGSQKGANVVKFLIDVSCADNNITCNTVNRENESNIRFEKKITRDNQRYPYQNDTNVKFNASMIIKDSTGQELPEFDTGAAYEMPLTYGSLNVYTGKNIDWMLWGGDAYSGIRSYIGDGKGYTTWPVSGAFVPIDLTGGRYLPAAKKAEIDSLNLSGNDKTKAVLDATKELYVLLVSCETPPASGTTKKMTRIRVNGSGKYTTGKNHPLVDVIDYYDASNLKWVLSITGATPTQSEAGLTIYDGANNRNNVDINGWYAHYTD